MWPLLFGPRLIVIGLDIRGPMTINEKRNDGFRARTSTQSAYLVSSFFKANRQTVFERRCT